MDSLLPLADTLIFFICRERGGRQSSAILETLAQESYDMITLLPTYIENTRTAILSLGKLKMMIFTSHGRLFILLLAKHC